MLPIRSVVVRCALLFSLAAIVRAQPAPEKPLPDAQFGNWLYKTPDPKLWTRTESGGALIFSTAQPAGDFCTLTLFADTTAGADFAAQFAGAVDLDQKAKGTLKIEADSGPKPGKSAEGYEVLTRNLRAVTSALHTLHLYVAGHDGAHFSLAAFQTTSESSWKYYGPQASQFLLSLKLASSLPAADVAKLLGQPVVTEAPPALAGFDDAPAAVVAAPVANAAVAAPIAEVKMPELPLNRSPLVVNNAVIQKDGKPINGLKLSQHDSAIYSPSIAVAASGVIHVSFVEQHRTTYALAAYHRSSSDGGKTWAPAKNLSEDMPRINVGRCLTLIDRSDRVYVVWRAGLAPNFNASPDQGNSSQSNIVYRVLENGQWSRIKNVFPAGSAETQNDAALSFFAVIDAAGRAQVVWNSIPDKWHPELTMISGVYHQHLAGIGSGLVFQATLDGSNPGTPREIFLPPVGGQGESGGYGLYCDGLDTLNGYVDAGGAPHFVAAVTSYHDQSFKDKSRYQLIEGGKQGAFVDFPQLSFHGWRDIPTLLVDATGKRHLVALYPEGEHPNIRDYVLGADEDPVIIRETVGVKGSVDGFQAFQGPNGRMVALMQMNDSGERANGETYVSISSGHGWSVPVNVTNNAGRQRFASSQHGASGVVVSTSYYPGPAAGAFDREGHLLLLMINNEYGLFGTSALGVTLTSGSSSTPTLQFLRL